MLVASMDEMKDDEKAVQLGEKRAVVRDVMKAAYWVALTVK